MLPMGTQLMAMHGVTSTSIDDSLGGNASGISSGPSASGIGSGPSASGLGIGTGLTSLFEDLMHRHRSATGTGSSPRSVSMLHHNMVVTDCRNRFTIFSRQNLKCRRYYGPDPLALICVYLSWLVVAYSNVLIIDPALLSFACQWLRV
jgi:hypothetical protein